MPKSSPKKNQPAASAAPAPRRLPEWAFMLALLLLAFAAYYPSLNGGFVWDDDSWTANIEPMLRDGAGLWKMWRDPTALQQYYPLSGTTFWLDFQCWGWWTLPYHVENLLLHLAAALLFWRVLVQFQVPGAWLAAAVFAVHPVMVESVAWITERKNVLSLVFFLAALLSYGRFVSFWHSEDRAAGGWRAYTAAMVFFILALLAKVTAFAFPAVLLVLCWWRRGSIRWRADVLPLLPFFAVAIAFGLGIAWLETHTVGASGPDWDWSWPQRFLLAGRALWFYACKVFLPLGLSFIYPQWTPDAGSVFHWLMLVSAVGVFVVLWLARARLGRGPLAAACLFAGTLFPVLGFMNVYGMRFSVVADHWVYVSTLPLLALMAAGLVAVMQRLQHQGLRQGLYGLLLLLLALQSWRQAGQYRSMETLWRSTLEKNPGCWMAWNNLGNLILQQGKIDESISFFSKALELRPHYAEAHNNLGEALLRKGLFADYQKELDRVIAEFQSAVDLEPWNAAGYYNLGSALLQAGKFDESISRFEKALSLKEAYDDAHNNLGVALVQKNRVDDAISHYRRALQLRPSNVEAMVNLGAALLGRGQVDEAVALYEQALKLQPDHSGAHNNLGMALLQKGRAPEAMQHLQRSLELRPTNAEAHCNLAKCLSEEGKFEAAIQHYESALKVRPGYGDALYGLGVALSRTGHVKEAVQQYQLAVQSEPARADARINLGNLLLQLGDVTAAVDHLERAVELAPGELLSHNSLGNAYLQARKISEAVQQFELALKSSPDNWVVLNNLAWILATSQQASVRDGVRAVSLARQSSKAAGEENPFVLRTLAAAYAEAGQFDEALQSAASARRMAQVLGNTSLAEAIQAAMQLYQAKTPFRDVQ
ncbi:tetratricopeptide repeat protein [Prosthecobacter vanneervenii]|uniref:Tetratricopeptide (TPR) repeat protein n=1 Tax=Prosthecobacter vanneervenii TaxID=48466 RepID=A0A7W7YD34_9BACT|nr:tetratricopeptide repeat protein [Prosthecobacter vanneervenii]MBB5033879.1 tetratricopeptide (TPR) repeat protein [Prosthecobacter vanneervenii]